VRVRLPCRPRNTLRQCRCRETKSHGYERAADARREPRRASPRLQLLTHASSELSREADFVDTYPRAHACRQTQRLLGGGGVTTAASEKEDGAEHDASSADTQTDGRDGAFASRRIESIGGAQWTLARRAFRREGVIVALGGKPKAS